MIKKRQTNITKHSDSIRSSDNGASVTRIETWVGPYDQLITKQNAAIATAKETSLDPTEAGEGRLAITYIEPSRSTEGSNTTIEVIWAELRKKIEEHPRYADLSQTDLNRIHKEVADPNPDRSPIFTDPLAQELYLKLISGTTEYSIGAPVVRRTTTNPTNLDAGSAWVRSTPPAGPSGYEWLKTADEIRHQGSDWQRVEEWTGAQEWDANLYS